MDNAVDNLIVELRRQGGQDSIWPEHPIMIAAATEIEKLRLPFRAVDAEDWAFLMERLGDGGRGRFWKSVFAELRAALTP